MCSDKNVEKLETLSKEVLPVENVNGSDANKVNSEIWRQIPHQTKSLDTNLHFQKLILKSLSVLSKTANALNEHRSEKGLTELAALV